VKPTDPRPSRALAAVALSSIALSAIACDDDKGPPIVRPTSGAVRAVASTPVDQAPVAGQDLVLGTGWYANVEVDAADRVHLAWVDADRGDVHYTTMAAGADAPEPSVLVEHKGAVGAYLMLALTTTGAPVLAYGQQDERTLRLAHRPADLAALAASGAVVDATPPARDPERMGADFVAEDITFGDQVGMAGALVVGRHGVPHLVYYSKGTRFRYARRAIDAPTFGPSAVGRFELVDVDLKGGSSYTMRTDLRVLDDGTVFTSYCNWTFKDATQKVAWRRPGEATFTVMAWPETKGSDGWQSTLLDERPGVLALFSVAIGDQVLRRAEIEIAAPRVTPVRHTILARPSAAVVRRRADGTLVVLARVNGTSTEDPSGVFLIEVPVDGPAKERVLLDEGAASDPWLDLALRADGRPVAVWTSSDHRHMRMYAP